MLFFKRNYHSWGRASHSWLESVYGKYTKMLKDKLIALKIVTSAPQNSKNKKNL